MTEIEALRKEAATLRAELDEIKEALPEDSPCRHPEITGVSLLDDIKDLVAKKAPWVSDYDRAKLIHGQSAEIATLRELAEGLAVGLACALRQWQSYAQDDDGHDLETSGHLEGRIYRIHAKSLKDYRAACPGEGK